MVEDAFLYCLTLFTFSAIFGLCYIRSAFTTFEKKKIPIASTPSFPFGNVGDVIFRVTPLFAQLWKYHNRFKTRKYKFGGFYVFLKPAVVVVDHQLIKDVVSSTPAETSKIVDAGAEKNSEIYLKPWAKIIAELQEGEVDVRSVFFRYVLNVSSQEIFDAGNSSDDCDRIVDQFLNRTSNFGNCTKMLSIAYPGVSNFIRNSKHKARFTEMVAKQVAYRKKNDVRKNDIIQGLINESYSVEKMTQIAMKIVKNLEIAANLLSLCLYELGANQEIQEDLRGEIARFKKNKSLKELDELSYLETVVCETLRKYPPKPFVYKTPLGRNYLNAPENVLAFVSIFGIHHDPMNYTNPEMFDPDRFSEENEKFISSGKYLPFGSPEILGSHVKLIMKLGLIEFLPAFKCSAGKKSKRAPKFDAYSFGLKPKEAVWLNLRPL